MSKIKFYKSIIKLPKTTKIKTIVGKSYLENYKERIQRARKIALDNNKAIINSKDIKLIGKIEKENKMSNKEKKLK